MGMPRSPVPGVEMRMIARNEMEPCDDHRSNGTERSVAWTGCCAYEEVAALAMVSEHYGHLAVSGTAADAGVRLEDAPRMAVVETLAAPRSERSQTIWRMSYSLLMIVARHL
jgi:hypothetical protein